MTNASLPWLERRTGSSTWVLAGLALSCGGKVDSVETVETGGRSPGGGASSAGTGGSGERGGAGQHRGDMTGKGGTASMGMAEAGGVGDSGTSASAGAGGTMAGTGGGGAFATPPSCDGLAATCGPSADESCCTSPLVTGGAFYRSYDGVTLGYERQQYPATVSDFRLDKYEVTVGRFRNFVAAWNGGWRPASGAGKHTHVNGGSGLTDSSGTTTYDPGWDTAWASNVAPTDANLQCDSTYPTTWTPTVGTNENLPISCENWYEAYAFCIWDGGFLPSTAEWNYAASGGSEQRVYPWSSPARSTTIDCGYANHFGAFSNTDYCVLPGIGSPNNVGSEPNGNGKYGQADLAGNVYEWNLDWWQDVYVSSSCDDCVDLPGGATHRVARGGGFRTGASYVRCSIRVGEDPSSRASDHGVRCARIP